MFLLILYLWTPYLNILPLPAFPGPLSPPSQNTGNTSLPPGTVTSVFPEPKLVQSQSFNYRIQTRMVSTPTGCMGTQGCLTWITPQGNLTFSKEYPFAMSYSYFGNNAPVSLATFGVKQGGNGLLTSGASTVTTTATTYDVNTTQLSSKSKSIQGYLDVTYDFASTPFKATATYNGASSSFSILWLVSGYNYVTDPVTNTTSLIGAAPAGTNATIGPRSTVSLTDSPAGHGHHTLVDVHDAGSANFVYGKLPFYFEDNPNANLSEKDFDAVAAVFPQNRTRIDPTLVQMNESTCSYVCGGSTVTLFSSSVTTGDMLVATVVSDDLTTLTVSDSLGTTISSAVRATTSVCDSNSGSCQADIYWGLFPSSGSDTVTVSEGTSSRALRTQIWEFSGVTKIGNMVSCSPTCSLTSFPPNSVLIATARDVYGAGAGFTWYVYAASGVAGSELQIPTVSGATTFPFSTPVNDVEAGAVLIPAPPPATTPPWGERGLSPYESYVNNAIVYVSLGNGLVSIEQPTFDLPGRGLSVAPALLYSEPGEFWPTGKSPYQNDNFTLAFIGLGWSLNLPWLGTYAVHLANGQQYPYTWNGTADMQVHGPVDFELTSTSASGFCPCVLTLPSGIQYTFNIAKELVQESDTTGLNSVSFSYGSNGMLSSITDTVGRQISFGYNGNQLVSMTAPGGRTWTFSYTVNQLGMTDPVGRTTIFKYSSTQSSRWLISEVDYPTGGGRVVLSYAQAPATGGVSYVANLRNIYSAPGSLARSDQIRYNFDNGVLLNDTMKEADCCQNVQGYVVNVFSPLTGTEKTYLKDSTGATFRVTEKDFVNNRLNTAKIEDPSGNVLAHSSFSFDNWGNVIYTKDNVGHETWLSYANSDSSGAFGSTSCSTSGFYSNSVSPTVHDRLVGSCDFQDGPGSAQQEAFYQYNALGELTEQKVSHNGGWLYTDYAYDSYGNVISTKDANGNFVYNSYSSTYQGAYLTKTSLLANGQNITTYHAYDFDTGFTTSTTDPDGHTTSSTYDKVGRLLTATFPPVNGVSSVAQQSYDDTTGTITTTDPNGNVVREYFDGIGRETRLERWNGTSVYSTDYFAYNWMDKVASLQTPSTLYANSYDSVGRLLSQTNVDRTSRTASYNDFGNFVTTKDEDGRRAYYAYDWDGRLLYVTQYSTSTQPYTTSYVYDGVGNLLSVDNNIGQITSYTYDDLNRLTRVTAPDGNSTQFGYDSLGNLISKTTANGAVISYSYDQANRLASAGYPDGSHVQFTYSQSGNILTVSSTLSGLTTDAYTYDPMDRLNSFAETVSGTTYTTSYSYDKASNLVKVAYPDGLVVSMTYDVVNRLKNVGSYATLAYNQDDTIASVTFGDGEVQTYSYDSRAMLTGIEDVSGSKKLMSLSIDHDGAGNVDGINNEKYTFDNMSRILTVKGGGESASYAYDGAGNILSSTSKNTQTVFRGCGYYPNTLSGTIVQCGTDRDGNIVSKTGGWAFDYNFEDEMTAARLNGATVQTNVYDGVGNRVERTETDSMVFTFQGINLLFEKDLTTGTTTDHIYGDGMQLAKVTGGTTYYYHEDQVGSNRAVTYVDSKGKVATEFSSDYGPYGSNLKPSGSEVFQYTDRMLDSSTGLYYFNARFYDPSTMRFMTSDPVAGDTAVPAGLNSNAYAGDNPVSTTDPTGATTLAPNIDLEQLFFWLENQFREMVGLPMCDAACQATQAGRFGLILPLIGMYTGEGDVITGGDIYLTKKEAMALARAGGWGLETPDSSAGNMVKGDFGGAVVRGWLKTKGWETFPYATQTIKITRSGSDSVYEIEQEVDILSRDRGLVGEVKTRMKSAAAFEGPYKVELSRMVQWRNAGTGRQAFTALVNYYSGPVKISGKLSRFSTSNDVPIVRFIVDWEQ